MLSLIALVKMLVRIFKYLKYLFLEWEDVLNQKMIHLSFKDPLHILLYISYSSSLEVKPIEVCQS